MRSRDLVLRALAEVARGLGAELPKVVFVGGAVAALYEELELDIRPTNDVDVISAVSLPEYYALIDRLRARGFKPSAVPDSPLCRLVLDNHFVVDVMPIDPRVLGFSNRWYKDAARNAQSYTLPDGTKVKAISPLYFVATKLEAFKDRGQGDFRSSHDLEDLLLVLGQSEALRKQVEAATNPVTTYVRDTLKRLTSSRDFVDAIPGCFVGSDDAQEMATVLTHWALRLRHLSKR
ncbi:MAG: hypothetical protein K1X64_16205 [Myxococcaceae bacterium]|nr:hypothetical protein [Myxococcaceae bacterium]